jgi:hypothetical protein
MSTIIRSRAAALGIAAVAGIASLGVTAGPASAATGSESATPASAQAPQSSGYPTSAFDYADELVTAYGNGDDATMDDLATQDVVDALAEHFDAHTKRWHRTAADSGMGHTWVSYTNLDTHEVMILSVRIELAADGKADAVRQVQFGD